MENTDLNTDFSKYLKILNEKTKKEYKFLKEKENKKLKKSINIISPIIIILIGLYFYYDILIYLIIGLFLILGIIIKIQEKIGYEKGFYDGYRRANGLCDEDSDFEAYTKIKNNFNNQN